MSAYLLHSSTLLEAYSAITASTHSHSATRSTTEQTAREKLHEPLHSSLLTLSNQNHQCEMLIH